MKSFYVLLFGLLACTVSCGYFVLDESQLRDIDENDHYLRLEWRRTTLIGVNVTKTESWERIKPLIKDQPIEQLNILRV